MNGLGWAADIEVPDPDEPGFDPIDRARGPLVSDKPPASFYNHVRSLGVTSQKIEDLKSYIQQNRSTCKKCKQPIFWCSTSSGKRIPIDFPDQRLRPNPTHVLVPTYGAGGEFMHEVEAWPKPGKATHTTHFDTCKGGEEA